MRARGLDALTLSGEDGRVLSSGQLPARAGDVDPELVELFAAVGPGEAVPRELSRATPEGVEPMLTAAAWSPVPGASPPLRVTAGLELGASLANRLAALTGGAVEVRTAGRPKTLASAAPRGEAQTIGARLLGRARPRTREIALPSTGSPRAFIAVTLPVSGLARVQASVRWALLGALVLALAAATVAGHLVARRVTRPVEALAEGARRVREGDLSAQVRVAASAEMGELVAAFNAMTGELSRATARAAAAERVAAWREVARRLAHEVKNPLTPVAMSVETLREAWKRKLPAFGELFEEGTRAIAEEVRRLVRIVDAFSRFARLPAPERGREEAAELLSAALSLYPEEEGGVQLTRALEADLPAVDVDRDQFQQVVHNLVKNALEALAPRGHGAVRVSARPDQGGLRVEVEDDGPGIAPQDLPHVMEPYFSTKKGSEGEGGTGLGLAIASRIAEEHGGRLEVSSTVGEGTTFTLWLPAAGRA